MAKRVYEAATDAVKEELEERGEVLVSEAQADVLRAQVISHWVEAFLADDNYYLEANSHPLRCLGRDVPKYGFPSSWKLGGGKASTYQNLDDY